MNKKAVVKLMMFIVVVTGGFVVGIFSVLATDRIKSLDFVAFTASTQISSSTSTDFAVYIGDNLSGVTNPIKSIFIEISGVYTGGGTLGVSLDSNVSSLKTFALPSVSGPTRFQVLYKDPAGIINPTSAGAYHYSLDIAPSGVVISGFSAVAKITARYNADACDEGQPSNEKIKTTDFLAFSTNNQISAATSTNFQIYLGDDLTGIVNPIKSIFIEISGVYTGGGTLGVSLDSNASSLKTFVLPSVSSPTEFNINYSDGLNIMNPSSAGAYNYQLNLDPSGVVLSGAAGVVRVTHRYKPPSCASGYPPFGDLTSAVFDVATVSTTPAYNSVFWRGSLGGPLQNQGVVKFRFAASNNSSGPWTDADFVGGSDCNSSGWFETAGPDSPVEIKCFNQLNNKKYIRYKVRICSSDCAVSGDYTPTVDDVVVSWSP